MKPQTRSEIRSLLDRHGTRPRKALGQHFLADPNIIAKIVRLARIGPESQVVEVGAGTGSLSLALAATGARVVAYEIDRSLAPILAEVLDGIQNIEVRFEDVMSVDLARELGAGPWTLVANLPYNVGTPLVLDVLREVEAVTRLVVMVQQEVAERLVAMPGSTDYGLPSVVVGLHGEAELAFKVPPQVFVPPPNVSSAVVAIERKPAPKRADEAIGLAAVAFGQRRKMLRRSLSPKVPEAAFERCGIRSVARPEELSPDDWLRLAGEVDG